jgi:predicted aconitase with swiveling domain
MSIALTLSPLVAGPAATGALMVLAAPISFWGGVHPATAEIIDARHPNRGRCIAGSVLVLPGTIGSSSASSVLVELIRIGKAPAAILMPEPDAILLVALSVAREMGWPHPPAWRCDPARLAGVDGRLATITTAGDLTLAARPAM